MVYQIILLKKDLLKVYDMLRVFIVLVTVALLISCKYICSESGEKK